MSDELIDRALRIQEDYWQRDCAFNPEFGELIDALADAEARLEAAESALREIQFLDCCYDCRIVADRALGEANDE